MESIVGADGRQDITMMPFNQMRPEEHLTIVHTKGYVHHNTCVDKTSPTIASKIISVIDDTDSRNTLKCVDMDGTNVNSGWKTGAIRRVEENLGRSLLWIIVFYIQMKGLLVVINARRLLNKRHTCKNMKKVATN